MRVVDENSNKYYKTKIVQVNDAVQTLRINYVGQSDANDEILSVMSSRIKAWGSDNCLEVAGGGPAELNFDDSCLPKDESQSSLTHLEAFLDRSALRMGNIMRKLDSRMCDTTEKGDYVEESCIVLNESIKVQIAVGDEVQMQNKTKNSTIVKCWQLAGRCNVQGPLQGLESEI